ncbi:MAG: protein kinase [Planctomycetota bacterium]
MVPCAHTLYPHTFTAHFLGCGRAPRRHDAPGMDGPDIDHSKSEPPPHLLERAAERLLGRDTATRTAELDDLVRAHPEHEASLRRLARDLDGVEHLLDASFASPAAGVDDFGAYRVRRVIGEGAFGVVYLCTQEMPVQRDVAIKVLRPGSGDHNTLARFDRERHVLATLGHPAIAQVYDAGALGDGRPYFVMEYVRGEPISTYCDRARLDVDARLELFARLCLGVQHAHEQGVIHRDLKPANVLVFEQDGRPQPKIIDFGIAKAVGLCAPRSGVHTETGRVIGTPGYMSPEQAMGARDDIDERADVFALGVMLYELLTGELPWGRRPETTDSEPPRPSARVATDTSGDVARQRAMPARKLASRLRGDLDWIVLMALARARHDRYRSVQHLASDIGRHLRGEPVHAGPPTLGYRLRKFLRRHRSPMRATLAVALALGVGLAATLHFAAEARRNTVDVEAAARSLLDRARDRRVVEAPRSEVVRRALANDALALYERILRQQPDAPPLQEGRARALWTLSQVHWLMGEFARSEAIALEATRACEALLAAAPDHLAYRGLLGNALRNLGRAASSSGRLEVARASFERAVQELERCHQRDPQAYADLLVAALTEWAAARTPAELDACAQALRRAVAIQDESARQRPSRTTAIDLLDARTALVHALVHKGDLKDAADEFAHAEKQLQDRTDLGHGTVCHALRAGALVAAASGDHPRAIERAGRALAAATRWSEDDPARQQPWAELFELQASLAIEHMAGGDRDAALAAHRAAIQTGELRAAKFPDDALARGQLADELGQFALALLAAGRRSSLGDAEAAARRAMALLDGIPDSVDARMRAQAHWSFAFRLGAVLDAEGAPDAVAVWLEVGRALDTWRGAYGVGAVEADHYVEAMLRVARCESAAHAEDAAATHLDAIDEVCASHGPAVGAAHHVEACRLRALLAARHGDADTAARASEAANVVVGWRGHAAAAEGMTAAWRAARSGPAPSTAAAHRERAVDLCREALASLEQAADAKTDDPWIVVPLAQTRLRLAELLLDRGERDQAQVLAGAALPLLTRLRDEVHADQWDEGLFRAGQAMATR